MDRTLTGRPAAAIVAPRPRVLARYWIEGRELMWAGGAMLAAAALLPALPGHPGLPCPLRTMTGIPCPFCGMTTSVEATAHLHIVDALAANPAGIAAVVVAIWVLVKRPRWVAIPALPIVAAVLGAMWIFELVRVGLL